VSVRGSKPAGVLSADDSSPAQIILNLFAAVEHLHTVLNRIYAPAGLSEHKYLVLCSLLAKQPNSARPSELAPQARITRSSMTQLLDDLERRNWVERRPDPNDRRIIRIHLTAAGAAMTQAATRHFHKLCRQMAAKLTPSDQRGLSALCRHLDATLQSLPKELEIFAP
jgi:DNA-binding MarR family transcriptional regulator